MLLYEKYSSFIFYHISLLITHFNEWNTPQTKKLSGALYDYCHVYSLRLQILAIVLLGRKYVASSDFQIK